ncbi:peptidylprolyl isomerase [Polycladidibacter stylochi]|uniref:peptidylprolyl isomerase n=1 Tax=Polycladidibacter stylochi TaxID=1807766 RepID=UPI00082A7083|nr:peptidylprolyl isomerase [Pseudovibrio stylochi]
MLDALRQGAGSWAAKILIGLLVLSFAVWGIADVFTGLGSNAVAKVGKTEISATQFQQEYQRQLETLSRQIGQPLTPQQGAAFGIPQRVLSTLVTDAALNDEAAQLKVGVSDAAIVKTIHENPMFQGLNGKFDRSRMQQVLYANNMTEDRFVSEQMDVAQRQQLVAALLGGFTPPQMLVKAMHTYRAQARTIDYLVLTPETLPFVKAPSDEELQTYFKDNLASYRAPEYRSVKYLELTASTLAKPEDINEEDVKAEYERTKDSRVQEERRQVYQLSFASKDAAQAAEEQLKAGTPFTQVVKEQGHTLKDIDLGMMKKSDFIDKAVADAAFSLKQGQSSEIIEGTFTTAIINVAAINPEQAIPYEDVAKELRQQLAAAEAASEIDAIYNEIEDARAGGSTLDEVAKRFSLAITQSALFDNTGNTKEEKTVKLPEQGKLIKATFDSELDSENDPVETGNNGFIWYELTKVEPARDRSLDEVHSKVTADFMKKRRAELLAKQAEELLKKLDAGTSLAQIAKEQNLTVQTLKDVTREQPKGDLTQEAVAAAFSGPTGLFAQVNGNNGSRLLINAVSETIAPFVANAKENAPLKAEISRQLEGSMGNLYVGEIQKRVGVTINQANLARVSGLGNTQ